MPCRRGPDFRGHRISPCESVSELVQRARGAIGAQVVQDNPTPSDAASNATRETKPSGGNFGIFGVQDGKVPAPFAKIGSNGYIAANCASFLSGNTPYTMLVTTDGTGIFSSSTLFSVTLNAACSLRGAVAINVTAVRGSALSWDAIAY